MKKKTENQSLEITINKVERGVIDVHLLGASPIILNRLSEKVKRELLLPRGKKNAAEKASTAKHNPFLEFTASPYTNKDDSAPAYLQHLCSALKGAIRGAALDLPGTKKAQIGRLLYVEGERFDLFGVPKMFMVPTRCADMNRTPDIRTRVIVPQWACTVSIRFVRPILNEQSVVNLVSAAGYTQGIGDWRPEKGAGNYGTFEVVNGDDPRFLEIVQNGGRAAQMEAMENPEFYDDETKELYAWATAELTRRGLNVA